MKSIGIYISLVLSILLLGGFFRSNLYAQDLILRTNGDTIKAKVFKIGKKEIEYKWFVNNDGPTRSILISDVSIIAYQNGTYDTFTIAEKPETYNSLNSLSLFQKGQADAKKYYKGYKSAANWSGFGGFFLGGGILPGVILANIPPRYENLNFPDPNLMRQADYSDGYKMEAYKIKHEKVVLATVISTTAYAAVVIGAVIILTNSISHR